jgi:hypothetical protein
VLQVFPTTLGAYVFVGAVFVAAQHGLFRDHLLRDSIAAVLAAVTIPHAGMVLRYDQRLLRPLGAGARARTGE